MNPQMYIVTIPILLGTPLSIAPDWATDTVAFLVGGISYTVVGVTRLPVHKRMDQDTTSASTSIATQAK